MTQIKKFTTTSYKLMPFDLLDFSVSGLKTTALTREEEKTPLKYSVYWDYTSYLFLNAILII